MIRAEAEILVRIAGMARVSQSRQAVIPDPDSEYRHPGLDPNAVDLGRMPLIQNPCFRRGISLVIPAKAGIQVL